jgi:hypothetical protein
VRWGLAEFRRRFGRDAQGMWLPETAADDETLDVLAEAGVGFTVLAPHQVRDVDGRALPPGGRPGRVTTTAGRTLAVFSYDEAIAHDVAFGGLLRDGRAWATRMRAAVTLAAKAVRAAAAAATPDATPRRTTAPWPRRRRHGRRRGCRRRGRPRARGARGGRARGDRVERRDLRPPPPLRRHGARGVVRHAGAPAGRHAGAAHRELRRLSRPTPRGARRGARRAVELELSARRRALAADCGCRHDGSTHQRWRAPLRTALQQLRDALAERFAREGAVLFGHLPGGADAVRDAYNDALPAARGPGDALAVTGGTVPPTRDPVWARELLDMEREALAMFDSDACSATTSTTRRCGSGSPTPPARRRSPGRPRARSSAGCATCSTWRRATIRRSAARAPCTPGTRAPPRPPRSASPRASPPPTRSACSGRPGGGGSWSRAAWSVDLVRDDGHDPRRRGEDISLPAGAAARHHRRRCTWTVADRRLGHPPTSPSRSTSRRRRRRARRARAGAAGGRRPARHHRARPPRRRGTSRCAGRGASAGRLPPSGARERVERALRRAVIRRLLDEHEREQLASGAATLEALAGAALVRAVDASCVISRRASRACSGSPTSPRPRWRHPGGRAGGAVPSSPAGGPRRSAPYGRGRTSRLGFFGPRLGRARR